MICCIDKLTFRIYLDIVRTCTCGPSTCSLLAVHYTCSSEFDGETSNISSPSSVDKLPRSGQSLMNQNLIRQTQAIPLSCSSSDGETWNIISITICCQATFPVNINSISQWTIPNRPQALPLIAKNSTRYQWKCRRIHYFLLYTATSTRFPSDQR